jgi:hypothetical protein
VAAGTAPASTQQQVAALSKILGLTPGSALDPAMARVLMIREAQQRGLTWAQIASCLGAGNGKMAKRMAKQYARQAQGAMLAEVAKNLEVNANA